MQKNKRDILFLGGGIIIGMLMYGAPARVADMTRDIFAGNRAAKRARIANVRNRLNDVTVNVSMTCATTECDNNTIESLAQCRNDIDSVDAMIQELANDNSTSVRNAVNEMQNENNQNRELLNAARANALQIKNEQLQLELERARDSIRASHTR